MTVHLPEDQVLFIREAVRTGRFTSEDQAVSEAVRLLQQREEQPAESAATGGTGAGPQPSWQRVLEIMQDLPDAAFEHIPADSSTQLDHYLYGTPKRPTP